MKKLKNCWEFMKCGYGPKGPKTRVRKICPAAQKNRFDGIHRGLHGGRVCWFIDNTYECNKGAEGDFSNKFSICMNCEFYKQVRTEEESRFEVSLILHTYLQNK